MSASHYFGQEAEERAANFYHTLGYLIREKNYRYRKAEVDLIVQKEDLMVAVEVKARSSLYFGSPESFVSQKKFAYWLWQWMLIFNSAI